MPMENLSSPPDRQSKQSSIFTGGTKTQNNKRPGTPPEAEYHFNHEVVDHIDSKMVLKMMKLLIIVYVEKQADPITALCLIDKLG